MTWVAAIHLHNNIATVALPPTHTGTHTHTASWHRVMVECAYMTDYTGVHTDINCLPHSHTGTPWLNVLTWLTTWTYMPVLDTHHHTLIRTRACTHTHTHTRIFTVQCAYKDDYMHKKCTVFLFTHRLLLSSHKHTHSLQWRAAV